ncbi:stAR-related lipid transfer protein 7, mitochondrial [Senna tora]|uniref:StAR-related lipid transfer protein 7, mitochondrial n=1 Tax=Senna tora TaxID=362788 RepID=A0A835CG32_9FABA|nr:stAR-related lipid transfer protein 7, mitochondrial [Senna tora]
MGEPFFDLVEFLKKPSITETFVDILLCAVPIWLAVMIGLLIGWSWRPRWTGIVFLGLRGKFRFLWTAPPGFGARRLWLAFTALSAFSICRTIWSNFKRKGKGQTVWPSEPENVAAATPKFGEGSNEAAGSSVRAWEKEPDAVTQNDLEHLLHLLEGKDGVMDWQCFMERSTPNMSYQAWRHEPETGPTVYRSKTVFEDATPELVRDFFWDDDFRPKWDTMLAYCKVLEECPRTGITIVHWIKKFPFFCSDREYIIARRIWEAGNTYYCVTKGVPYPSLPKRDKPRRVELYFSSWVIKPVESRKGDGQMSACEVTLLHYEDMGIPKDVAKLGVRHGMWGAVKKLHSGMRAYQNARKAEASLSRCALNARITTKISMDKMDSSEPNALGQEERNEALRNNSTRQNGHGVDWKWVAIGGTVALVLGIHSGAVGKVLLLGAGHRIARR